MFGLCHPQRVYLAKPPYLKLSDEGNLYVKLACSSLGRACPAADCVDLREYSFITIFVKALRKLLRYEEASSFETSR